MYSYTTGGPFGLEDQVTTSGPGLTLLYHLVLPFFWCIPVSLVVAELTTAIPVEGGFYRWVRAGYGDFWGFLAGWWNWTASFVLGGAYAVLFSDYLSFYFPHIAGWKHFLTSAALIVVIAYINVRGIQMVGIAATALEIFILLPVAALCFIAAGKWQHNPFVPFIPPHVPIFQVFGVGLALGLWLYSGYEQLSSVAEEVENPQRNYPLSLAMVVPLSIATYFLPTMLSLAALGNWQQWHTGYFSDAAQLIGGRWLGFWMTLAAMVTNISLLNATVLTSTRMPSTMAEDGYLPPLFTTKHSRYGTPWIAILVSSGCYALFALRSLNPAHYRVCMAADRNHRDDRARGMETSTEGTSSASPISYSLGTYGTCVRGRRSNRDGGRGLTRQRPLCVALGPSGNPAWSGGVFICKKNADPA